MWGYFNSHTGLRFTVELLKIIFSAISMPSTYRRKHGSRHSMDYTQIDLEECKLHYSEIKVSKGSFLEEQNSLKYVKYDSQVRQINGVSRKCRKTLADFCTFRISFTSYRLLFKNQI